MKNPKLLNSTALSAKKKAATSFPATRAPNLSISKADALKSTAKETTFIIMAQFHSLMSYGSAPNAWQTNRAWLTNIVNLRIKKNSILKMISKALVVKKILKSTPIL